MLAATRLRRPVAVLAACAALPLASTAAAAAPQGPAAIQPDPREAYHDRAGNGWDEGCWAYGSFEKFRVCRFGDRQARYKIALLGNSHAAQWLIPLRRLAHRYDLRITTFLIAKCFTATEKIALGTAQQNDNCHRWGRWAQRRTNAGGFDLVVTSQRTYREPLRPRKGKSTYEVWRDGYRRYLEGWSQAGTRVLVIRDNPVPGHNVPRCVAAHRHDPTACAGERRQWLRPDPLFDAARATRSPYVRVLDLTRHYCPGATCPAVIAGKLVYRDHSHVTATYMRALQPFLEPALARALRSAQDPSLP